MPDDFADLIGVRTKLRVLQSEYGDLDLVLLFFLTKKTQCRQSLPDDFMCFYGMQFMHKQFMFSILYIHILFISVCVKLSILPQSPGRNAGTWLRSPDEGGQGEPHACVY